MNRIEYTNKIISNAARFVLEVEGFNASSQYDINIHAENFLIPVLNEVFNLKLENVNTTQKKNFPAVDLVDFINRVAFQVTATADWEKIKGTIEKFVEYKLDKQFDTLYIYILTHKKEKYPEQKLQALLTAGLTFTIEDNIVDKDDILRRVNTISSTPVLQHLAKLYEHEFSDVQIEARKTGFAKGYLKNVPEEIIPNLLPISFNKELYIADLSVDQEAITAKVNDTLQLSGKPPVKTLKPGTLVKHALRALGGYNKDWILHENSIYTFRNLGNQSELMSRIVDKGTVTSINCRDFYEGSDANMSVFKHLLRNALIEYCRPKGIEWFAPGLLFRFANNPKMPNKKQIKWKGKNEATKTVIFDMINKKEGHIICFRNLAFKASFEYFLGKWYLSINPTWSFTNPYGYKTSRFEPSYMAGIKRMENNASVYNYFRFFGYHLTYTDLFTTKYPYLKIEKPLALTIVPALDENTWKPVKMPEKDTGNEDAPLDNDTELNKTLFD